MFSPYYAGARRRGSAQPAEHCAVNVALYGRRASRWAMTERGAAALRQDAGCLAIGPSALIWDGTSLEIRIDEVSVPWPCRLRGRLRLHPMGLTGQSHALDAAGRHRWWPLAPRARVEVHMESPALAWRGQAYLDCNAGTEPLEQAFSGWHWSRASHDGTTRVHYDVAPRQGAPRSLALEFGPEGSARAVPPPPERALPGTLWRLPRRCRSEGGARLVRTLEDTPFYARSLLATRVNGTTLPTVHESLCLDRFRRRWVQLLLPFRMPRRGS